MPWNLRANHIHTDKIRQRVNDSKRIGDLASEDVYYNYCHLQNQYRFVIHVQGSLEIVSGICKWGSCPIYKWNPQKEVIEFPPPPLLNDIYS